MVVAAGQAPVSQENNAHHRTVEQQLLFAHRSAQCGLGTLLLVDVIKNPDRTLGGIQRVDQPTGQAAPEQATIAAAQLALHAERLSLCQNGVCGAPQFPKGVTIGVESVGVQAYQALGTGVAKYLGISLVAAHHTALAQKHDTDARTVEQGLLFTQGALQGVSGAAAGRCKSGVLYGGTWRPVRTRGPYGLANL